MSGWDAFIAAMQQVGINNGCIMTLQGVLWAATPGFTLDSYILELPNETEDGIVQAEIQEHQRLLYIVTHEGNAPDDKGIYIGRKKYFRVNFDPEKRSIYLKSKDGFACIAFTGEVFVYGSWVNLAPGPCNERVEYLAGEIQKAGH